MVDGWDACELLDTFAKSLHTAAKAGTEAAAWGLSHPCVCPLRLCPDTAHAHVKVHDHELQLWVCPLLHEIHVPTRNRLVVVPLPPSACSSQLTLLLSCNPVSCVAERTQRAPRNRRLGQYRDLPFSFAMNLNSSSDEEEAPTVHPSQLQPPPPPPPVQPPPPVCSRRRRCCRCRLLRLESRPIVWMWGWRPCA